MNWLLYCFLISQAVLFVKSAPADVATEEKPDCKNDVVTDVYDERQNASDMNIRLNMKGIAIIVGSPELGAAALESIGDSQNINNMNNQESVSLKPPAPSDGSAPLPIEGGIRERTKVKLSSLLQFLKHLKSNQSYS